MQLSRFVAAYRDARPGEHVLYDVVGDRYVGVDDVMLAAIERWRQSPTENDTEGDAQTALIQAGILVENPQADEARLEEHFRRSTENPPEAVHVTWMPTLACNLACTYCFQKDHPAAGTMSAETEAKVLEWALARVAETGWPKLVVHYIGGEPLLRQDLLVRTAQALSAAMTGRGGTFEWELTTNGIGLDPKLVEALLQAGPGVIKFTLDGDRETHDAARVHRNGQGTFEEVFASLVNVARACPAVKLRVGGNFLPGQAASYERLLDRLERAGLRGRIEQIRFKPTIDCAASQTGCAERVSPESEADTLVQIGRSVQQRGLAREPLPEVDVAGLCEIYWKNAYTIDPQGYVYRCLAVAGRTEVALGRVGDGPLREDPLVTARAWERYAPCATCCYLPVCAGGCPGGKYLETGRFGEVLCRQEHFQKTFREEIVHRYLAEFYPEEAKTAAA